MSDPHAPGGPYENPHQNPLDTYQDLREGSEGDQATVSPTSPPNPDGLPLITGRPQIIQPPTKARFGVVNTVFHQSPDSNPVTFESRYARWLDTLEQPYMRKLTIGPTWIALDHGWIDQAAQLWIQNDEGKFSVIPTQEQRDEVAQRILIVGVRPYSEAEYQTLKKQHTMRDGPLSPNNPIPFWTVRPGESIRGEPIDLKRIYLRCKFQQAKITIGLFPS